MRMCPGRSAKRLVGLVAAALTLSSGAVWADDDPGPLKCERLVFPVALAEGAPADNELVAWLCARGAIQHKTLQLLIHGATFDHGYWDFPYQPEKYSYVRYITDAGYAVLNIDRVGRGQSTRPVPGIALDLHVAAYTIQQIIQTLRAGTLTVEGFGPVQPAKIVLVGHSMGSFISSIIGNRYKSVDGIILTGYSHTLGPGTVTASQLSYPAVFDPKFATSGLPLDYFTVVPGAMSFSGCSRRTTSRRSPP